MHVVQGRENGDLTCATGRLQGKPASNEPKRRTPKHPKGPTTGARNKSDSLCSHQLSDLDESETAFEQDGDDGQPLPSLPDKEKNHTVRQLSQLPSVPAAVEQSHSAINRTQLALASQAGETLESPVSDQPITAATEPQTSEVQTHRGVVQTVKAAQGDSKQSAAGTDSAAGLIGAFRPMEQLPANSAAASSPASTAGSNASDSQAAGDLQEIEFRSHLHALLLRAKVLRLEESAHTPEDAREKESRYISLPVNICPVAVVLLAPSLALCCRSLPAPALFGTGLQVQPLS